MLVYIQQSTLYEHVCSYCCWYWKLLVLEVLEVVTQRVQTNMYNKRQISRTTVGLDFVNHLHGTHVVHSRIQPHFIQHGHPIV